MRASGADIVTQGRAYKLSCAADDVDAGEFERLVRTAADDRVANGQAHAALAMWRGPPLVDIAEEPFAAAEIRRLEELRLRAQELAIELELEAGRHDDVLGELATLVAEHPLREHLQGLWMLALYRAGRQADALEAYRRARQVLVEEIGAEPGPELHRLHQAILGHEDTLAAPSRSRTRMRPPSSDLAATGGRSLRWARSARSWS